MDPQVLMQFIDSREFQLYNEHLKGELKQLKKNLELCHGDYNKVQFTQHDLTRMMIKIVRSLINKPLESIYELMSEIQATGDGTEEIQEIINKVNEAVKD